MGTNDVELVVGARNDAKAVLDEIGSQLRDLAVPAQQGADKANSAILGLTQSIARMAASSAGIAGTIGAAIAGIVTVQSFKAISEETKALGELNRELDHHVDKRTLTNDAVKSFANEVKRTLGVDEAETIALMTKASTLGVVEDQLDDAAIAAIGLAKALGTDTDTALRKLVSGDERLVDALATVNAGLIEQQGDISGLAGFWNLLQVESKAAIESLSAYFALTIAYIQDVGTSIKNYVLNAFIGAVTTSQIFRERFAESLEYVGTVTQLIMLQITESLKHTFTVAGPAYFTWFTDNFVNLMRDGFMAVLAIQQNFNQALGQSIVAVWDFIASGGEGGIAKLKADMLASVDVLLTGFEAKAASIPEVISRQITDKEKELLLQMGKLGGDLGKEFNDRFAKNKLAADQFLKPIVPQLGDVGLKQQNAAANKIAKLAESSATTEGRLLKIGTAGDPTKRLVDATENQNKILEDIRKQNADALRNKQGIVLQVATLP